MAITLKPGTRLFSAVCETELITVRAPEAEVEVTIGGAPPVLAADDRTEGADPAPGHDGGAAMGKRYVDADGTIELLCTRAGRGAPALDGELLGVKESKPLPASD